MPVIIENSEMKTKMFHIAVHSGNLRTHLLQTTQLF